MNFHDRLISELTQLDKKESTRDGYNPHALGLYFKAAEGVTDVDGFCKAFNPTRGMHRIARNMGMNLDVKCGEWIKMKGE